MRRLFRGACLIAGVAALLSGVPVSSWAQTTVPGSRGTVDHWQLQPTPESAKAELKTPASIIAARDAEIDALYGNSEPLDSAAPGEASPITINHGYLGEMPVAGPEAAVVVGVFTSALSCLTASRRSIYSVAKIRVDYPILSPGELPFGAPVAGTTIDIVIPGGAVTLASGKTITWMPRSAPLDDIQPGHRYILFLRYWEEFDSYDFGVAWDVSSGIAESTNQAGLNAAKTAHSRLAGLGEADAVTVIRGEITAVGKRPDAGLGQGQ